MTERVEISMYETREGLEELAENILIIDNDWVCGSDTDGTRNDFETLNDLILQSNGGLLIDPELEDCHSTREKDHESAILEAFTYIAGMISIQDCKKYRIEINR